jgi:VCBS repeat-containing protein
VLNSLATSVLANDSDTDLPSDVLTAVLVSGPTNGSLTLNADGTFSYTHDGSETTSDSFTYRVNDGTVAGNTVTVAITVTPVNDPTVLSADAQTSLENTVATGNVLANDRDVDNPLTVTQFQVAGDVTVYGAGSTATIPGVGTMVLNANGAYTFTPVADYNGPVPVVTYTVNTGATSTLTITVTPFFPPPLERFPVLDPAAHFSRLSAPPPVGIVMPVMPPPELPWSPNGQNMGAMPFDITKVPNESAPHQAIPNPTFDNLGQQDAQIQDQPLNPSRPWPSCPVESPSTPAENMMSVSDDLTQRLTNMSDNLEQSIELRERQTDHVGRMAPFFGIALSAGFAAWILRGGSLMRSFLASMPAWRHLDPLSVLGSGGRDRRKADRKARAADKQKNE